MCHERARFAAVIDWQLIDSELSTVFTDGPGPPHSPPSRENDGG
jgi:hypothetical protein